MAEILVCPLSWGLGHATRDVPVIREFLRHGHRVTIGTSGPALALLKQEFPGCSFFLFPDYPAPYTRTPFFVARFTAFIPKMLRAIGREKAFLDRWLAENRCDLIVSDNRFGVFDRRVPSFFISHQLRFDVPPLLFPAGWVTEVFNGHYHRFFRRVIVPDNESPDLRLSGKLSRSRRPGTARRAYFAGLLSSVERRDLPADIDCLFSVSGPEPQRTALEQVLLGQAPRLPGRKVLVLGRPAEHFRRRTGADTLVISHASRAEMTELVNRARFIVCRSGYTTMMELAEIGGKKALLVPTPGQTEQEYLARYYLRRGWYFYRGQYGLDLPRDVRRAASFAGFPRMPGSRENAARLYRECFAPWL